MQHGLHGVPGWEIHLYKIFSEDYFERRHQWKTSNTPSEENLGAETEKDRLRSLLADIFPILTLKDFRDDRAQLWRYPLEVFEPHCGYPCDLGCIVIQLPKNPERNDPYPFMYQYGILLDGDFQPINTEYELSALFKHLPLRHFRDVNLKHLLMLHLLSRKTQFLPDSINTLEFPSYSEGEGDLKVEGQCDVAVTLSALSHPHDVGFQYQLHYSFEKLKHSTDIIFKPKIQRQEDPSHLTIPELEQEKWFRFYSNKELIRFERPAVNVYWDKDLDEDIENPLQVKPEHRAGGEPVETPLIKILEDWYQVSFRGQEDKPSNIKIIHSADDYFQDDTIQPHDDDAQDERKPSGQEKNTGNQKANRRRRKKDKTSKILVRRGKFSFFRIVELIEISFYEGNFKKSQIYFLSDFKSFFIPITGDFSTLLTAVEAEWKNDALFINDMTDGLKNQSNPESKGIKVADFLSLWGWTTGRAHFFKDIRANLISDAITRDEECPKWDQNLINKINYLNADGTFDFKCSVSLQENNEKLERVTFQVSDIYLTRWNYINKAKFTIIFPDNSAEFQVQEKEVERPLRAQRVDISPFGFLNKPVPNYHKRPLYSFLDNSLQSKRSIAQKFIQGADNGAYNHLSASLVRGILLKDFSISDVLVIDDFEFWDNLDLERYKQKNIVFRHCFFRKRCSVPAFSEICSLKFIDCRFEEGFKAPVVTFHGDLVFLRCYFGFDKKLPYSRLKPSTRNPLSHDEDVFADKARQQDLALNIAPADISLNLFNSKFSGSIALYQSIFSGRVILSGANIKNNLRIRGCWLGKRINSYAYLPIPFERMPEVYNKHSEPEEDQKNQHVQMHLYENIMNYDWRQENIPGISLEKSIIEGDLEIVASCDEFHNATNIDETYKILHTRGAIMGDVSFICGHIQATGVKIHGNCFLTGLLCTGNVDLNFSTIGGNVSLASSAAFRHHHILHPHCYIQGTLRLDDSKVSGNVNFSYSYIKSSLTMVSSCVEGSIHLTGAYIGRDLSLHLTTVQGYITAYPKLSLSQLDEYGYQQWQPEIQQYTPSHDDKINRYRLLPKVMKHLFKPLYVGQNIDLSGVNAARAELRGIEVQGHIEIFTGTFGRFLLTYGFIVEEEILDKSSKKLDDSDYKPNFKLSFKPCILTKIRIRSIQVKDIVDLSGIVLLRTPETSGSALRLTHSEIGGDLRFNNEHLFTDAQATFPDLKNPSFQFIPDGSSVNYDRILPDLKVVPGGGGLTYSKKDLLESPLCHGDLWDRSHDAEEDFLPSKQIVHLHTGLKPNAKVGPVKKELIEESTFSLLKKIYHGKSCEEPEETSEEELGHLYLYANTISGSLDMRNTFVRGAIYLNGSSIKRKCIMSSNRFMEAYIKIDGTFKTCCDVLHMVQLNCEGEIDLTGLRRNTVYQKEHRNIPDFINATNLMSLSDLLFFRPSQNLLGEKDPTLKELLLPSKKIEACTSRALFDGGVILDGARLNRLALSYHNYNFVDETTKDNDHQLSMNHITMNEFQLDSKLHFCVRLNMSESDIKTWKFVDLVQLNTEKE